MILFYVYVLTLALAGTETAFAGTSILLLQLKLSAANEDQASVYSNSSQSLGPAKNESTQNGTCVTCVIFSNNGVIEHYWWASELPLTVVTVHHNVTIYENSQFSIISDAKP